ncbi:MAG: 16S rRNA (cytidine(1402)-2'-O)-methyltransferase [Erysipelotrichia bacterium]|nr:16S rRNA (cytidine(1402)-2'-O)-methyltransferase [Erysipelotrichia bacterium]NCC54597.1 16S rRNA (cytidine(1402)-2'-O)-methyltransferase [Erysipelotrichia bacterium]
MKRQKSFENEVATLYLVATPIGNLNELSTRAIEILQEVDVIAAEDTRNTMKLLTHFNIGTRCIAHHLHNEKESANGLLKLLEEGKNIALVSDAGYPLLSDPGAYVVNLVIQAGYNVVPISGANAALNALVASGLSPQPFIFYGFLGNSEKERMQSLHELKDQPYTIILYEAPHRIEKMLHAALEVLGNRNICLARELTKKHEEFIRGTISEVLEIVDSLKGEMVVIVEGCTKEKDVVSAVQLSSHIDDYISEGLSSKEAIKKVAKEYGVSKNDLYKNYHGLN